MKIFLWIKSKLNKVVDMDDIIEAFEEIEKNPYFEECFESGRSYFFEGINQQDFDETGSHFEFNWGS